MNCIHIPGSNQVLYDGSIVILANYPNTKWIVHEGWYTYNGKQYHGWYFCEIPSQTILPVNEDDLKTLTIVDNGCGCPPGPPGPPMPPMPDRPFTPQMAWELDRAWISVPTIAHRDNLNKRFLPDGKIVRVDEVTPGVPGYFRWDQVSQTWVDETFGIDVSEFVTSSEVATQISNSLAPINNQIQNINKSITTIESDLDWKLI